MQPISRRRAKGAARQRRLRPRAVFIFLVIGLLLYVFYTGHAPAELGAITVDGRVQTDRVLPQFIVTHLPAGLAGLVSAAILAAAMSSSLNASAAAAVGDFYMPLTRQRGRSATT